LRELADWRDGQNFEKGIARKLATNKHEQTRKKENEISCIFVFVRGKRNL
jgi:hypothetical protein